jgi:(2Fe-2S) ferredoxin
MYVGLTRDKIDRIIDEHIIGGRVVEEYVVPEEMWGDPIEPASVSH